MATQTAAQRERMAIDNISYEDLYARWEKGNWRATELDFSQDYTDWHETFTDLERRAALWNYSMFFHGEDSVTDNLSPYIDAAPREEQKYFLATQQVDEARHAVFFGRFMKEVVERGSNIAGSLAATQPDLTWGFRKTFAYLDKVADNLRRDKSKPNFAAAITMYHLVVEATLAQPGQHFIEGYLNHREILPGFRQGMENVSKDEQRHIGFGVKCLSDLVKEDPDCKDAVADLLRDVTTLSVGVFVPPNWDRRYVETFGKTIEDVYEEGMKSLESKLRAAGLPLEELPGPPPFPLHLTPRERAEHAVRLLEANVLGEKTGPPSRDPEVIAMLFDTIAHSVDTSAANGGMSVQWEFTDPDVETWHLTVENGSSRVAPGEAPHADLRLRLAYQDWADMVGERLNPMHAVATRRLRPRGNPLALGKLAKVFPRE